MRKIVFLCHGNICRSVAAEYIAKDYLRRQGREKDYFVYSRALSHEEIGNDIYPPMKRALSARGYSCPPHGARQATRTDCDRADHILCADFANVRNMRRIAGEKNSGKILLLLSWAGRDEEVADPWYTRDFDAALDDIEEGCVALLAALIKEER